MGINDLISFINDEKSINRKEFVFFEYLLFNDVSKEDLKYIYSCVNLKNKFFLKAFNFYFSHNKLKDVFDVCRKLDVIESFSDSYNMVIKEFVALGNSLGCNNSLDIGILFALLLRKGVFSITKSHEYDMDGNISFGQYYVNLFYGNGVCLNYSDMLKDIYRGFGYNSVNMLCDYSILGDSDRKVNHVVTLIEDKEVFYLFDSTFLMTFNCINNESAVNIFGFGKISLLPYLSSCVFSNDKFSFNTLKRFCLRNNSYSLYDKSDFADSYSKIVKVMNENECLISEFAEKIKFPVADIVAKTKVKR